MGRGVSYGGGQSSLGYLFGGGDTPKPSPADQNESPAKPPVVAPQIPATPDIPAGVRHSPNNYFRADGQNTGNFITDRPSTKVHAAPGGGSSLGYLFGGGSN